MSLAFLLLVGTISMASTTDDTPDINAQDINGNTLLHYFIKQRNVMVSLELLSSGARTDIVNNDGVTAVELAYSMAMETIAEWKYIDPIPPIPYGKSNIEHKIEDLEYEIKLLKQERDLLEEKLGIQQSQTLFLAMILFGSLSNR